MKHFGTKFEYTDMRDEALMSTYRRLMASEKYIRLPELLEKGVNSPSKRFWVSEERAAIVLSQMFKGDLLENMSEMKREMFMDLYEVAKVIRSNNPGMSMADIAFHATRQPARKFYIKAASAKVIIHRIKKKWLNIVH